ncbi:branched-chain amino acid ABC transporter permease [Oceanibacterium hippocampi]|uniref:High-affinity branched-chain amino acid transport system permease protein LivH n=1 Tax=Oceanibacterium hippocampi TaxID=745714 RepID=A0A1Y5SJW1_9PROT|nr:branched-chain amino acid ABC transporter permease [Oceanibacterium hippocampi]SLN42384.1 High-affinity branched-chain amino acid transport system permease protein LivH [Oceanibacterium hippocampi]
MSFEAFLIQTGVNGLILGALYLLMAVGFTLVFGSLRVVNFAHGEFYMLGGFAAYFTTVTMGLPAIASIPLAFLFVAVLGLFCERAVFRPFRGDELNGMIASIGLALILQNGALMLFGPMPLAMPPFAEGLTRFGSIVIPTSRLLAIVISAAVLAIFYVVMMHTRVGRAVRAMVQDAEVASTFGIHPGLVYPLGFALGVGLAAVAGAVMAPLFSVSPFTGHTPLLKAFLVVVLGGLGSIPGAAIASLAVGLIESYTATFYGSLAADGLILLLAVIMLVMRPNGLLGRAMRVG